MYLLAVWTEAAEGPAEWYVDIKPKILQVLKLKPVLVFAFKHERFEGPCKGYP
jgi:hypothetical protein